MALSVPGLGVSWRGGLGGNPCGCEDDDRIAPAFAVSSEQPPRVRGRRPWACARTPTPGGAPAGAGTTRTAGRSRSGARSNSRRRGDDVRTCAASDRAREQPPPARGRPPLSGSSEVFLGATPASAGTTRSRRGQIRGSWSNPRGHGDDTSVCRSPGAIVEQPPRARGRRRVLPRAGRGRGATPADAGTTPGSGRGPTAPPSPPAGAGATTRTVKSRRSARSNPRGRGDDSTWLTPTSRARGQPLRARGRREGAPPVVGDRRANSADARATSDCRPAVRSARSSPRISGEDNLMFSA